jgi:hypothetical protein
LFAVVAMLSLLLSGAARAADVAIGSIAADPQRFDHQSVTLAGSVTDLKETTSHAGNGYTAFKLQDGSGSSLTVFA